MTKEPLLAHIEEVQRRWDAALAAAGIDAVVVAAGASAPYFLDDQSPPFRPNPHFAQWVPGAPCEHGLLLVRPGGKARLFFLRTEDYWHVPPAPPEVDARAIELIECPSRDALMSGVLREIAGTRRTAYLGEVIGQGTNLPVLELNPVALLHQLDYRRAVKTPFEVECMRAANRTAASGHLAALRAYEQGASEYATHLAYLEASSQTEAGLPYSSIVAQNEHAGVLHYQHYDRTAPAQRRSFLIDAGAKHLGYAADVTRTHAAEPGAFADLIQGLDLRQQSLVGDLRPGLSYVDLHERMSRDVGALLAEAGLVTCSADAAFESGITDTFFPHGLGHLLGLQTHDVGGHQVSPDGAMRPPPERYPALRLTREIETSHVFTVEPGIYFIPMLLARLRASRAGRDVSWDRVEALVPFGGIRIEDNVLVTATGHENLTRDAFASAAR